MSDKENTQTPPESEKKKKLGAGKIILIVIASNWRMKSTILSSVRTNTLCRTTPR